jgi:hypothetical protein
MPHGVQLLMPHGAKPLILTLHEKLGIDKSAVWEELAKEFDTVDEVSVHGPVPEDIQCGV